MLYLNIFGIFWICKDVNYICAELSRPRYLRVALPFRSFWDKVLKKKNDRVAAYTHQRVGRNPNGFCSSKTTLMVPSSFLKTFLPSCQDDLSTYWQENIYAVRSIVLRITCTAFSCRQPRAISIALRALTSDSSTFISAYIEPGDNSVAINFSTLIDTNKILC